MCGPLAQLVEQLTLNQQVPGSSPGRLTRGEVSELVDEHDLGSCAARRRSSSLLFPTIGVQFASSRLEAYQRRIAAAVGLT